MTIALERNPLPAGQPTWVSVAVKNTGADEVTWMHDGCATLVGVGGRVEARWREGLPMSGRDGQFKSFALGLGFDGRGPVPINIGFTPEWAIGRGHYWCADTAFFEKLRAGETLQRRLRWDGLSNGWQDPPPTGRVRLVATAGHFWRTSDGQPDSIEDAVIRVPLDAWISPGKAAGRLDPPEVIDIALQDPEFAAWFAPIDFGNAAEHWFKYLPDEDRWQVGLLRWYVPEADKATLHYLVIDPVGGGITDRVERLWDVKKDGWP